MTAYYSNFKNLKHIIQHGFTLIETLVAMGILVIFFTAITLIVQQVIENIGSTRVRTTALSLAEQKFELIRNLPYVNVGTIGGIPQGPIPQSETVTVNNLPFIITTSIIYVDDPYDGLAPSDVLNADYKRVRIEVTWGGSYPSRMPITLVTNIVPNGVESVSGGGTLYIQVFNANSQHVANANVTINNTVVTPAIHMQTLSNADGVVVLPGAPPCNTCYEITVTKQNYSTDKTYSSSQVTNPLLPYSTVLVGQITQISFSIDEVSTLIVNSFNPYYQPISNVMFTLKGSKIIGYDTNDLPVYKYSYSTNTGGGTVSIPGLEWDTYTLDLSNSAHTLAGSNPPIPFALPPKNNLTIPIVAVPKANNSLLIHVDDMTHTPQASASVELLNELLSYDQTIVTPGTNSANFGYAFFPALQTGTYDLKVDLPGYQEATSSVIINGNIQESVTLNAL